jgi:Cu(I)/Ag(I) efflux system protein CusF
MTRAIVLVALLLAAALGAWVLRAPRVADTPPAVATDRHAHQATGELAEGEVLHIDKAAMRITISHGPIHDLGLPAMTFGFVLKDAALLETLRPGERIRFAADAVDGRFTVTKIERAAAK